MSAVGESILAVVSVSHRAQQIIAITLGVVLLGVTGISLAREPSPKDTMGNNNASDTSMVKDEPVKQEEVSKIEAQVTEATNEAVNTIEVKDNKPVKETKVAEKAKETEVAKEADNSKADESKKAEDTKVNEDTTKNFVYTAEPGDSYTALARSAVQKYATANKTSLSDDQLQQTAAVLAFKAGSPFLEIGQVVTIMQSDISVVLGTNTESTSPTNVVKAPPSTKEDKNVSVVAPFSFVAVSGDSYSLLARKAISDYAAGTKLDLTGAQRIAAETYIISDAGFPEIAVGQVVTFSKDSVKNAVDTATNLSATKLANWQPYVALAGL